MSDLHDNRRRSPRQAIEDTLFVETVSADQVEPLEPKQASTINASAHGLQVALDFEVLVNAELVLWITSAQQRIMVSGKVRWAREQDEGRYLVGIEVDEEAVPEMQRWSASRHTS